MGQLRSLKVAVLMGGVSGEREVSLKSGKAVLAALRQAGHEAVPYDVTDRALPGLAGMGADVAFLALHGAFGEDGQVQQMLQTMDLPYTGAGPEASRLGMDKLATKRLFIRHAIPTPDYLALGPAMDPGAARAQAARIGYPLVCKPSQSGSSLGVRIVRRPCQLEAAVAEARAQSPAVLLERYVRGREFTVGVLAGEALPMIELVVRREFFDYEAKYVDQATRYVSPVSLLPTLYRKACAAALRACRALGCECLARVDLIYGYDGALYLLEANTIPGLTPRSLLPMAAAEAGIPFPALCDRLVQEAVKDAAARAPERRKRA